MTTATPGTMATTSRSPTEPALTKSISSGSTATTTGRPGTHGQSSQLPTDRRPSRESRGKAGSRRDPGGSTRPGRNQTPADSPTVLPRPAQVQPWGRQGNAAGQSLTASSGRRRPGAQPAPDGRVREPQDPPLRPSGGPAARGRPARRAARHAGRRRETSQIPGPAIRQAREWPSTGPLSSGGIRIRGPVAPGRRTSCPRPACASPHGGTRRGGPRAPGPCCPNPGQTVNNPPRRPARPVLPQRAGETSPHDTLEGS